MAAAPICVRIRTDHLPLQSGQTGQEVLARPGAVSMPVTCPIKGSDTGIYGHSRDQHQDGDLHQRWSGMLQSQPSKLVIKLRALPMHHRTVNHGHRRGPEVNLRSRPLPTTDGFCAGQRARASVVVWWSGAGSNRRPSAFSGGFADSDASGVVRLNWSFVVSAVLSAQRHPYPSRTVVSSSLARSPLTRGCRILRTPQ